MRQLGTRFSSYHTDFASRLTNAAMENLMGRLFKPTGKEEIEREVEAELRFHLELLIQANLQHMTLEDAKDAAVKRLGNIERIKEQCVEIKSRNHPLVRALKYLLLGTLRNLFPATTMDLKMTFELLRQGLLAG